MDNTSGIGTRFDYWNIRLRETRGLLLLPDNLGGPPSDNAVARVVPLLDPQLLVNFVRSSIQSVEDGSRRINRSFYNLFNNVSLNAAVVDVDLADTRLTILEWESRAVSA